MIPWIMFAVGATSPLASHSPLLCNFIASAGSPQTKHEGAGPKSLKIHAPISDLSRKYPILTSLRNSQLQLPPNHILAKKGVGAGSNHPVTPPSGVRRWQAPLHTVLPKSLITITAPGSGRRCSVSSMEVIGARICRNFWRYGTVGRAGAGGSRANCPETYLPAHWFSWSKLDIARFVFEVKRKGATVATT
jgi:hypothetical protein